MPDNPSKPQLGQQNIEGRGQPDTLRKNNTKLLRKFTTDGPATQFPTRPRPRNTRETSGFYRHSGGIDTRAFRPVKYGAFAIKNHYRTQRPRTVDASIEPGANLASGVKFGQPFCMVRAADVPP